LSTLSATSLTCCQSVAPSARTLKNTHAASWLVLSRQDLSQAISNFTVAVFASRGATVTFSIRASWARAAPAINSTTLANATARARLNE